MPAKSKAQYRFMQAVAHGAKPKGRGGPTKAQAKEFVSATPEPRLLPRRARRKAGKH